MKKRSLRLLTLVLALVFCMSTFLACDPPEEGTPDPFANMTEAQRAFAIRAQAATNSESVSAYTITASINGSVVISSKGVTVTSTIFSNGTKKQSGIGTDEYATVTELATNITNTPSVGEPVIQVSTTKSGFQNGKMFEQTTEDGDVIEKVYSVITTADYVAYMEKYELQEFKFTESDCTTATSTQMEDGSWLLTFTGFTTAYMDANRRTLFSGMESLAGEGQSLVDIRVVAIVDADLLPKQFTIEFVFTNDDPASTAALPVLSQMQVYSDYNTTIVDAVDLTGYKNVGDLRQFTIYEQELGKRMEATTGEFETVESVKVVIPGSTTTEQKTTYSGSFENADGFSYAITGTVDDNGNVTPFAFSYADGVYTEGGETSASTDAEEKQGVMSLLDPAGVTMGMEFYSVTAGTIPNTYVFSTKGIAQAIAEQFSGASILTQSEALTVTYDETGALIKSDLGVKITLSFKGGSTIVTVLTTVSCTYN